MFGLFLLNDFFLFEKNFINFIDLFIKSMKIIKSMNVKYYLFLLFLVVRCMNL